MHSRLIGAFAFAAFLAVASLSGLSPAAAQGTSQFNCAMLTRSPFMCVKNEFPAPVVAVQAVPPGGGWFNPAAWITIPGGGIAPHGAAVVKFPAYSKGCIQTVVVRTADGSPHYFWNTNVCESTSLTVR